MTLSRRTRSSNYQNIYHEKACAFDMLDAFSNDESIQARLDPFSGDYNEELLDLQEELRKQFWILVEQLTDRQKEVIELYVQNKTQMEIAKELNISQSTVTKNINGSCLYGEEGEESRFYGGSHKKLKKLIEADPKINEILKKMQEIRSERW